MFFLKMYWRTDFSSASLDAHVKYFRKTSYFIQFYFEKFEYTYVSNTYVYTYVSNYDN